MKVLALRSIPLSDNTREGWRAAGITFARRKRTDAEIEQLCLKYGYDAVINLGDRGFSSDVVQVWNDIATVNVTMDTARLRKQLDGFGMPLNSGVGPHWHKQGGGWGGSGVRFCENYEACDDLYGEVQAHIDGTEYRVITVGDRVVQAMRKTNVEWQGGKHYFDYEWCGVSGIDNLGIIPLLKEAVRKLPKWERSIIGWDVIVGDKPYIIEANSCPGVNSATAKRIVKAMICHD